MIHLKNDKKRSVRKNNRHKLYLAKLVSRLLNPCRELIRESLLNLFKMKLFYGILILILFDESKADWKMHSDADGCTRSINFFENGMFMSSFTLPLPSNLSPGTLLEIHGKSLHDKHLIINFLESKDNTKNIAFHFDARFNNTKTIVVRNTMTENVWGVEQIDEDLTLRPDKNFSLKILSTNEDFKLWTNDMELPPYKHRVAPQNLKYIQSATSVYIQSIVFKTKQPCDNVEENDSQCDDAQKINFFGKGMYSERFTVPLPEGMSPGTVLEITGNIYKDVATFPILLNPIGPWNGNKNIIFLYSARFKTQQLIFNSCENERWGSEEISKLSTLSFGKDFKIKIESTENGFKVWTNYIEHPLFKHRANPKEAVYLVFEMPSYISQITYRNTASDSKMKNIGCKNDKTDTSTDNYNMTELNKPTDECEIRNSQRFPRKKLFTEVSFFGKGFYSNDFTMPLPDHFRAGAELQIFGTVPENTDVIKVILSPHQPWKQDKIIALEMNFRFAEEITTVTSGSFGITEEMKFYENNLKPGNFFNIRIVSTTEGLAIWTNGVQLPLYCHRTSPDIVTDLQIVGTTLFSQIIFKKSRIPVSGEPQIDIRFDY